MRKGKSTQLAEYWIIFLRSIQKTECCYIWNSLNFFFVINILACTSPGLITTRKLRWKNPELINCTKFLITIHIHFGGSVKKKLNFQWSFTKSSFVSFAKRSLCFSITISIFTKSRDTVFTLKHLNTAAAISEEEKRAYSKCLSGCDRMYVDKYCVECHTLNKIIFYFVIFFKVYSMKWYIFLLITFLPHIFWV